MFYQIFMTFLFVMPSLAQDRYHEHRGAEVEDAIKRYSREANVDIGHIKKKLFKRMSAGAHSLVTVSESTKFKYGNLKIIDILYDVYYIFYINRRF